MRSADEAGIPIPAWAATQLCHFAIPQPFAPPGLSRHSGKQYPHLGRLVKKLVDFPVVVIVLHSSVVWPSLAMAGLPTIHWFRPWMSVQSEKYCVGSASYHDRTVCSWMAGSSPAMTPEVDRFRKRSSTPGAASDLHLRSEFDHAVGGQIEKVRRARRLFCHGDEKLVLPLGHPRVGRRLQRAPP